MRSLITEAFYYDIISPVSHMKKRLTNQIFVSEDNYQNQFKYDICRVIEELNTLPFDFYISGGVICKFLLKEHSRYVRDIDIVTKCDLKEVESIFRQHLNVVEFISSPISDVLFLETFICLIELDGKIVQIDGMKVDYFDEINPEIYKINELSFKGVPFDYLIATKIHAITRKSEGPFKHLVDIYSVSFLNPDLIDKQKIKRYLEIYNIYENKNRKILNKPKATIKFLIDEEKIFNGSKILPTLQAGYNVSEETMIEEVNKWLSSF